jgi:hypothetical protein
MQIVLAMAAATLGGAALLGLGLASGRAGLQYANLAAAAFTPLVDSTHNKMGESVCGDFVQSEQPAENQGDLNAKTGSFLETVRLPDGARVDRLTMFANDFSDKDAHVYLVRKLIEKGLDPQFDGYKVMAKTNTSGMVNGVMRKFTDNTVKGARVDNERFYYYAELVVCETIEPFAIQVAYEQ